MMAKGIKKRTLVVGAMALAFGWFHYGNLEAIITQAPEALFGTFFILFVLYMWDDLDLLGIKSIG